MSVFKIEKSKDYTIVSNEHLRRNDISLKAKGLLTVMLSLPDNWDYSLMGLVAISKESETSIRNTLNELKKFGYVRIDKLMPNETDSGRIEYIYNIFEKPVVGNQKLEKQGVENLHLENVVQLNTKESSTKESSTKEYKENKEKANSNEFVAVIKEYSFSERLNDVINIWLQYKKEKKQKYTKTGFTGLLNKIKKALTNNTEQFVIECINNSIANNWQGLFFDKKVEKNYNKPKKAREFMQNTYTNADFENAYTKLED